MILRRVLKSGRVTFRARWTDPESGAIRYQSLDALGLYSPAARAEWARERAEQNQAISSTLASGARIRQRAKLSDAVADYLADARSTLRTGTITTYEHSLRLFCEWAAQEGIDDMDRLEGHRLIRFRAFVVELPMPKSKKKGKRGEAEATRQRRSARTVARDCRQVGGFLRDAVRRGLTPHLTRDAITDALKPPRAQRTLPQFLTVAEMRKLLEACQRHDAATHRLTREEHAGERDPGTTPKHAAIAPAITIGLLLGLRRGEIAALRWSDVDLSAIDEEGREVGELRIRAAVSKTLTERRVDLSVSPAARAMLAALKLRAGRASSVFGFTATGLESAMKRLRATYGAPANVTWHALRRTCATFGANSSVFGSASIWRIAKQLGHGVQVLERHYAGLVAVPRDARTLEGAMGVSEVIPTWTATHSEERNAKSESIA